MNKPDISELIVKAKQIRKEARSLSYTCPFDCREYDKLNQLIRELNVFIEEE